LANVRGKKQPVMRAIRDPLRPTANDGEQ